MASTSEPLRSKAPPSLLPASPSRRPTRLSMTLPIRSRGRLSAHGRAPSGRAAHVIRCGRPRPLTTGVADGPISTSSPLCAAWRG